MPTSRTSSPPPLAALAAVTLLAPWAGGAYFPWGQAALLCAVGLFFLLAPPRRLPGKGLALGSVALLLGALAAFLPASFFPQPAWRKVLTGELGVPLPWTHTPQPWMTFEAVAILAAALAWGWLLFSAEWSADQRRTVVAWFCAGIVALTLLSLYAYVSGWKVPLWFSPRNFGPFPNRNQMGNLLALTGLLIEALILAAITARRAAAVVGWALALVVIGTGLVVAYSRAGIGMFFLGSVLWLVFVVRQAEVRKTGAIALAVLVILLSSFLLFGGETLRRFDDVGEALTQDSRWTIMQDAVATAGEAPLVGHGLGNFEPVFAMKRSFWKADDHLLHPESDWFWALIEWGVPATLLVVLLTALALARAWPLAADDESPLRAAAFLGCLLFLGHGCVDVSAHRPGTLWPALLLLAVARRPREQGPASPWLPPVFRVAGLFFCALGVCWLAAYRDHRFLPSTATAWRLNAETAQAVAAGDHAAVVRLTTQSLAIRPLDYWVWLRRARARLLGAQDWAGAERDFRTARTLEPAYSGTYLDEGDTWLDAPAPDRALAAYTEAFRRQPARAPDLYLGLLRWVGPDIDGRETIRALAATDPRLWFLFLQNADAREAREEIATALAKDPALEKFTPAEQGAILSAWARSGARDEVAKFLTDHPALISVAWRLLADWHAEARRFPEACALAREHTPPPVFPPVSPTPLAALRQDLARNPADLVAAYAVVTAQRTAGDSAAALDTLRPLLVRPDCPPYVRYLEAELRAARQEWEKAWRAWQHYLAAKKPG